MVERIRLETYNDALGLGSLEHGVPGVRTEELGNEQLRRASLGDRVDDILYGADDQNVYRTDRRQRMQNVRFGSRRSGQRKNV